MPPFTKPGRASIARNPGQATARCRQTSTNISPIANGQTKKISVGDGHFRLTASCLLASANDYR